MIRPEANLQKQRCGVIAIVLCLIACILPSKVSAESLTFSEDEEKIERITDAILHKEIDLERYYLRYRIQGTKEPKYRRLRYYLLQVGSCSTGLASNIMFLKIARQGLHGSGVTDFGQGDADPSGDSPDGSNMAASSAAAAQKSDSGGLVERGNTDRGAASVTSAAASSEPDTTNAVRNGLIVTLVSTCLDAGSSVIELSSNTYTALKNIKQKVSPKDSINNVVNRIKEIDLLIAERQAIIDQNPASLRTSVNRAEGRVVRSFRDWCFSEFADVYADVKSTQSGANIYYVLDLVADSLYVSSTILGLRSLNPAHEKLGGPACSTAIVGDAFGIVSAPASTIGGNWLYKYWRNRLKRVLNEEMRDTEPEAKEALSKLNKELASSDVRVLESSKSLKDRIAVYLLWSSRYDATIGKQLDELRHQGRVALQGELSGPLISGTYLAQDIMAGVAFYGVPNRPRAGASLAFAGSAGSIAGTAGSLALTNYNLISEVLRRRTMRQQNILPEQLLAARLKTLDELDAILKRHHTKM